MTTTHHSPRAEREQGRPLTALQPPVTERDHILGSPDAVVTLVEYGDYECPYCARAHPVVQTLRAALGDELRFVFRNFPLTRIHAHALKAAEAAESVAASAGPQAFWRMHHLLFEHQRDSGHALETHHLVEYAEEAGAKTLDVMRDLDSSAYVERVRADFMSGVRSGVNGTPTFFINGERYDGDWSDFEAFTSRLREAAADAANATTPP